MRCSLHWISSAARRYSDQAKEHSTHVETESPSFLKRSACKPWMLRRTAIEASQAATDRTKPALIGTTQPTKQGCFLDPAQHPSTYGTCMSAACNLRVAATRHIATNVVSQKMASHDSPLSAAAGDLSFKSCELRNWLTKANFKPFDTSCCNCLKWR